VLLSAHLATSCMLVSCLAYSSTLKMEVTYTCETSVDFQRTTQRYILEDRTLHIYLCRDSRIPSRESNPGPVKIEAAVYIKSDWDSKYRSNNFKFVVAEHFLVPPVRRLYYEDISKFLFTSNGTGGLLRILSGKGGPILSYLIWMAKQNFRQY
jgi:hypothetical protein